MIVFKPPSTIRKISIHLNPFRFVIFSSLLLPLIKQPPCNSDCSGQSGEDVPTLGVLVTGGWASDGVSSSPELFIPGTNQSCHLPDMVTAR